MKKTVVLTIVLSFMLLVFTSCKSASAQKSESGEKVIRNFITAFYTVNQNDYENYEKMMKSGTHIEPEDLIKAYDTENKKFEAYLTDKSYVDFCNSRACIGRIENGYKKGNFVEVKDIKISKSSENKKDNTITYNFELQLIEKNKDTKKEEAAKKSGTLTVVNEKGSWKILDGIPDSWFK